MAKPAARKATAGVGVKPAVNLPALMTRAAFVMLIAIAVARGTMNQSARDGFAVVPGADLPPRSAGAATALGLDLLSALPAALVLLRRLVDAKFRLASSRAVYAFGILAGLAVVSMGWADDRFLTLVGAADLAGAFLLMWAGLQLVRGETRVRLVAAALVGVLALYGAAGLLYRFSDFPLTRAAWFDHDRALTFKAHNWIEGDLPAKLYEQKVLSGNVAAFSTSPNTYAAIVVMLSACAMGGVGQFWADRRAKRCVWVLGAAIVAGAIPLYLWTGARLAFLTFAAAAVVIAALHWRQARLFLAARARGVFIACVLVFVVSACALAGHGINRGNFGEKSLTFRWYYWTGAARLLKQYPATGVGWGNFGEAYLAVRPPEAPEEVKDPHNFFARAAAELGVPGLLLMIAFAGFLAWELTQRVAKDDEPAVQSVAHNGGNVGSPGVGEVVDLGNAARRAAILAGAATALSLLVSIDYSVAEGNPVAQLFSGATMTSGSAYVVMEVIKRLAGGIIVFVVMLGATLAPAGRSEWIVRGMVVGLGLFVFHNLIDFAMFEPNGLALFAILAGAALGARVGEGGDTNGVVRNRAVPVVGIVGLGVLWLAAAARYWLPMTLADTYGREGDAELAAIHEGDSPENARASARQAAASYARAMQTLPLNADYAFQAARALGFAQMPPAAIRDMLQKAIAADPSFIVAWKYLGEVELATKPIVPTDVRRAFEKALSLDPADFETRIHYAQMLETALSDPSAAAKEYRQALKLLDQLPPDEPKRMAISPARRAEIERKGSLLGG